MTRVKGLGMEANQGEGWYTDLYGLHEARWYSVGDHGARPRRGNGGT